MTVLLILATFAIFLTIDFFYSRKHAPRPVVAFRARRVPELQPGIVAGFALPDNLRSHPGHTWALEEGPKFVRLGLDDFAAKLIGRADRITLPQRGRWVRQGIRWSSSTGMAARRRSSRQWKEWSAK